MRFGLLFWAIALSAGTPLRVLLVTGGHAHDIEFYAAIQDARFRITVDGHPSAYRSDFRGSADVLVLYDTTQDPDEQKRGNLQAFVEAGKGVVVVHHGICSFADWTWWSEQVTGGRYRFVRDATGPASRYSHDEHLEVKVVARHPVTDGLRDFRITDETYQHLWISPHVRVLLETNHPQADKPVAWLGVHPRARVVFVQLGHDRQAHTNPNYQRLLRNAIAWAGGL